jgi:hypothetical protein
MFVVIILLQLFFQEPRFESLDQFNQHLKDEVEAGHTWANNHLLVAQRFNDQYKDGLGSLGHRWEIHKRWRGWRVKIFCDRTEDDSVDSLLFTFFISESEEGELSVREADYLWSCYDGRGHINYSSEPCY